jgi:hypothetical protein
MADQDIVRKTSTRQRRLQPANERTQQCCTSRIYAKANRLSHRGHLFSDREIANASFVEDQLSLFLMCIELVLRVHYPTNHVESALFSEPYDI